MLYQALLRRNRWENLYITWYSTCQNLPRSTTYCPCLKLTDTASSLAGGIEANAADGFRVDVVLVHGTLDRVADALPDVGYGLFLLEGERMKVSQLLQWMYGVLGRSQHT